VPIPSTDSQWQWVWQCPSQLGRACAAVHGRRGARRQQRAWSLPCHSTLLHGRGTDAVAHCQRGITPLAQVLVIQWQWEARELVLWCCWCCHCGCCGGGGGGGAGLAISLFLQLIAVCDGERPRAAPGGARAGHLHSCLKKCLPVVGLEQQRGSSLRAVLKEQRKSTRRFPRD
jgi:hypothetical protein